MGERAGEREGMGCMQPGSQFPWGVAKGTGARNQRRNNVLADANCECPGKGREDRAATDNEVNNGAPLCSPPKHDGGGWRLSWKKGFLTERVVHGELPRRSINTRTALGSLGESHWEAGG